ncbi:hypothetical protein ACLKA6_017140 [Drosophila palustris]
MYASKWNIEKTPQKCLKEQLWRYGDKDEGKVKMVDGYTKGKLTKKRVPRYKENKTSSKTGQTVDQSVIYNPFVPFPFSESAVGQQEENAAENAPWDECRETQDEGSVLR